MVPIMVAPKVPSVALPSRVTSPLLELSVVVTECGSSTPAPTVLPAGLGREEEVRVQITVVGPADLAELLPLMRAYCDFYQIAPGDQTLLELSQALLADPQREGLQLLARDDSGRAVGFATLFWTWQTLAAARVGVMNDLYVAAEARGTGVADGLIAACLERCREHGATRLIWQTAVDNHRAQAVYERIGATRDERWLDYQLPVDPG
jgi:GNAT superfamily N-acetyltransferase